MDVDLQWDDIALRAFLRQSLLKYRREPDLEVHLRYVVEDVTDVATARST